MRLAIIDLGTNSVRFDVHQVGVSRKPLCLHREKLMIRLGQDVFLRGKLDPQAIRRTLEAFRGFRLTAARLRVDQIVAFGTSALREASDVERLLRRIRSSTGIEVRVISGEEEARLIALGILTHDRVPSGRFALIDIGGGSTEISICRGKRVEHCTSFPLGTARLQQVFLKTIPPKRGSKRNPHQDPALELRRYVRSVLASTLAAEEWPKVRIAIASSGTARLYCRMLRKRKGRGREGKAVEREELSSLLKAMRDMTPSQLLRVPGMEAKRIDMILAGGLLLEECLRALGARKFQPTEFTLRDGMLEEEVRVSRAKSGSHLALHLPDYHAKAKRLGCSCAHLQQVEAHCQRLFDDLKPLHRLKDEWKSYLSAAAILHDVGESISPLGHSRHSYYIARNADFPSLQPWESEFIAQLCLWHVGGKVPKKELDFGGPRALGKVRRQAFLKLLAILRVADALDRGHKSGVTIESVKRERRQVRVRISGKTVDLELLRVEQKKQLFEQVLQRRLLVEAVG